MSTTLVTWITVLGIATAAFLAAAAIPTFRFHATRLGIVGFVFLVGTILLTIVGSFQGDGGESRSTAPTQSTRSDAPETDPVASGPTAETLPSATVTVRHHGTLKLVGTGDQLLDLDAPANNPQWKSETAAEDILMASDGTLLFNTTHAQATSIGTTPANYQSCRNAPGMSDAVINVSKLTVGQYMCIETSEHRFAALKILDINSDPTITFDVVVYDPPDAM